MKFRTEVTIHPSKHRIQPFGKMLFVGSCFAQNMGSHFAQDCFEVECNPYGVMYNPASILHTVEKTGFCPETAIMTLGTNHVYILKETGQIVDNCRKRAHSLFREEVLDVNTCADYLLKAIQKLLDRNPDTHVILTVSPIRYAKYGYPKSMLSKATLLLAADAVVQELPEHCSYFPAYEIMNDELRDYRFYKADMLHPTEQAVEYIRQQFVDTYFSSEAKAFIDQWQAVRAAVAHRPFDPDGEAYQAFVKATIDKARDILISKGGDLKHVQPIIRSLQSIKD